MIAQYVCRYALWCIWPWLCVFVVCRSLGLQLTFFSLWFSCFVQTSRWKSNCVLVFIATVFYWLRGFALLRPCFFLVFLSGTVTEWCQFSTNRTAWISSLWWHCVRRGGLLFWFYGGWVVEEGLLLHLSEVGKVVLFLICVKNVNLYM